jgi:cytoskeletal protein RodZ
MQEPRAHLSSWLRAGRAQRRLTLDDVSRVTKIQARILEKLESGQFDGLPAEVFVRGFVKSFARCVGLDESEALERYGASLGAGGDARVARALVDSMAELAPMTARTIEVVDVSGVVAEPVLAVASSAITTDATVPVVAASEVATEPTKKKRAPRKKSATGTRSRKKKSTESEAIVEATATVETAEITPVATAPVETTPVETAPIVDEAPAIDVAPIENVPTPEPPQDLAAPAPTPTPMAIEVIDQTGTWKPTMPPIATTPVPWRRPSYVPTAPSAPVLVIDDADPDVAERVQDARTKDQRVSFLPAILLDREDRSARQGGLTLAVIILLIAATLTLSYLMRRPSASGDGVTMANSAESSIVA